MHRAPNTSWPANVAGLLIAYILVAATRLSPRLRAQLVGWMVG